MPCPPTPLTMDCPASWSPSQKSQPLICAAPVGPESNICGDVVIETRRKCSIYRRHSDSVEPEIRGNWTYETGSVVRGDVLSPVRRKGTWMPRRFRRFDEGGPLGFRVCTTTSSCRTPMRYPWWGRGGDPFGYGTDRRRGVPPACHPTMDTGFHR